MPRGRDQNLWIIEFTSIDSSRDGAVAYNSRAEAVEVAADFAAGTAQDELENFGFDSEEDAETRELLETIIADFQRGQYDTAVLSWLEYQEEMDPDERIAIGPSGAVSNSSHDFAYHTRRSQGAAW